jgi:hypothetical protein
LKRIVKLEQHGAQAIEDEGTGDRRRASTQRRDGASLIGEISEVTPDALRRGGE